MIRRYHCQFCRCKRNFYHKPKLDDVQDNGEVVRYFQCADCGHKYSIMGWAVANRLDETPWEVQDVDLYREIEKIT